MGDHTTITVRRDVHERLRDYKFENRHDSFSDALVELLDAAEPPENRCGSHSDDDIEQAIVEV